MNRLARGFFLGILSSFFALLGNQSLAMTVDEAYRAIPHRQTAFRVNESRISSAERDYLKNLFIQVDLAMAARVETLLWFHTQGKRGEGFATYDGHITTILKDLKSVPVPTGLEEIQQTVEGAIRDQRDYFAARQKALEKKEPFPAAVGEHPQVRSASQKLHRAYALLMTRFPNETAHNRQAFFDYLCALDFL